MVSKAYSVAFERAWNTLDGSEDESIPMSLVFCKSSCGFSVMVVDVTILVERWVMQSQRNVKYVTLYLEKFGGM